MLIFLVTFHFCVSLALLAYSIFRMRAGMTLLNTFLLVFLLCCCAGVAFFEAFSEFLPPTQYSDVALIRLTLANLIFMSCAAVALVIEKKVLSLRKPGRTNLRVLPISSEAKALVMIASVSVILFLTMWLGSVGKLEDPFAAYKETGGSGQYYQYRQLVEEAVGGQAGRGTWTSKKLVLNVGPFLMILLAYFFYKTKNWAYVALILIQGFCGILVAGILAQKSFLLVALLSPLLAFTVWKIRGFSAGVAVPLLLFGFLVGGTLIFQATLNSTFGFALGELVSRVFLVPAFTPIFYYEVVPESLPFRGFFESLYIYHSRAPAWDYATFDVASHATGRAYGANANFLAIAYTGSGFLGVFWVAVLCLSLIIVLDYFLIELEPSHRLVAICCSGFGFIGITSINFLGALENGFLIGSILFFLLCRGVIRHSDGMPSTPEGLISHTGIAT